MMPTADISASAAGVTVSRAGRIILMPGLIQRLSDHHVLNAHVLRPARGNALVERPTRRTMIQDDLLHPSKAHPVQGRAREFARVGPQMTHNHILASAKAETVFADVDAFAGGGLA